MKLKNYFYVASMIVVAVLCCSFTHAQTFEIDSGIYIADGFYVGPLSGKLDNNPITVYCDDFDHQVFFGESWKVTENTFQDISQTRWHDLRTYENMAFLIGQMQQDLKDVGPIQEAIWRETSKDSSLVNPGSTYWFDLAAAQNFTNTDFSNFVILTPNNPYCFQEMIEVVPEPSTMLLAILGLGFAVVAVRRKA